MIFCLIYYLLNDWDLKVLLILYIYSIIYLYTTFKQHKSDPMIYNIRSEAVHFLLESRIWNMYATLVSAYQKQKGMRCAHNITHGLHNTKAELTIPQRPNTIKYLSKKPFWPIQDNQQPFSVYLPANLCVNAFFCKSMVNIICAQIGKYASCEPFFVIKDHKFKMCVFKIERYKILIHIHTIFYIIDALLKCQKKNTNLNNLNLF